MQEMTLDQTTAAFQEAGPEIAELERKLERIRRKQAALADWERSRRPIRIGFFVVIPVILLVEGVHLFLTLGRTQGNRAPLLMAGATAALAGVSLWYYRQAKVQRDSVLRGFAEADRIAVQMEARLSELRSAMAAHPASKSSQSLLSQ